MSDLAELARRLEDPDINESGLALAELLSRGREATPTLVEAARSDSADIRRLAMEGLGTLADPAALDVIREGLDDSDGRVRSLAAVALNRLGEPDAIEALAATLNDWPDLLHADMSRSAYELANSGVKALPVAIPLLASDDWADRSKGIWIITRVAASAAGDTKLAELQEIVAGYQHSDMPEDERARIARAAREWLAR